MSRLSPVSIAADTSLVRRLRTVAGSSLWLCDNSLVITGAEPAIVASGIVDSGWREGVFDVVEPADIRWIYVSSDHLDHPRGLAEMMLACPRAKLVASRAALRHYADPSAFAPERCREVDDRETFTIGDHRLLSVRAPLWSMPGAWNLLDQRTGVYWAATTFGCLLPDEPPATVAELDVDRWVDGMAMFAHHLAPWLELVDHGRFAARCDRAQALGMTTIASAHSPLITDPSIDDAFRLLRALPATPAPTWPGHLSP